MSSSTTSLLQLFPLSGWKDEDRIARGKDQLRKLRNLKEDSGDAAGELKPFHVRVPGRVNIIGEHIDYCGFGVLPMAIDQDVFITALVVPKGNDEESKLMLCNLDEAYSQFTCHLDKIREVLNERVVGESPPWYMYFLCGALGVLERKEGGRMAMDVYAVVDGCVPPRAGLSSSSALVVSGAITTLMALNENMEKKELAELCAKSERFIGTQGGGMDQAITILATRGSALNIEFVPRLSWDVVGLPDAAVFIIANSLVEANKAASSLYNNRVAECRISAWLLAKKVGVPWLGLTKLRELQLKLSYDHKAMVKLMNETLRQEPYSLDEIAQELEIGVEELANDPLLQKIKLPNGEWEKFKIFQRCKHVLQEAGRVEEFRSLSESCLLSGSGNNDGILRQLGNLMNDSHRSLAELFECSAQRLDILVGISQDICFGARLTGAGWGGCMVALLKKSQVSDYMNRVKREYYEPLHGISEIEKHVFVTQPGSGAAVYMELPL